MELATYRESEAPEDLLRTRTKGTAGKIRRGGGSVDGLVCIVLKTGPFLPEHKWGSLCGTTAGRAALSKEQSGPVLLQALGYCAASTG